MNECAKTKGRITQTGMGGFLNPPGHPEHHRGVSGTDFSMSLTSAVNAEWLTNQTRRAADLLLQRWNPAPLSDAHIRDWVYQVLGYFRNCYSPDGIDRDCSQCIIPGQNAPDRLKLPIDWHLGVMHIRRFYPDYMPADEDFQSAYWGKKQLAG